MFVCVCVCVLVCVYSEIVCIPDKKVQNREEECPLIEVCSEVRKAVEAGIKQVTSDINYVNAQHA